MAGLKRLAGARAAAPGLPIGVRLSAPGWSRGTTFNALLDTCYEYNTNDPIGRSNCLRPYDLTGPW